MGRAGGDLAPGRRGPGHSPRCPAMAEPHAPSCAACRRIAEWERQHETTTATRGGDAANGQADGGDQEADAPPPPPCARVVDLTQRIRGLKTRGKGRGKGRGGRGGGRNKNKPADDKPEPSKSAVANAVYTQYLLAEGHRPSAITLSTIASVYTADKTVSAEATEAFVLGEALKHNVKLDTPLYNAIVVAHVRKGLTGAEAVRLVDDMRAAGVRPDINTYAELLPCLARMRQRTLVDDFLDTMNDVDGVQVSQTLTESLVTAYCDVESLADAEDIVRRALATAKDAGRKGGPLRVGAKAFGPIINVHCTNGRPGEAWRLLREMQNNGVRPTLVIFNMLIKGFCKAENVAGAEGVLRELEGGGTWDMEALGVTPDKVTYATLLDFYASKGAFDAAFAVLERARRYGIVPDDVMWGTAIKAYARAGMPEKAEEVLYTSGEAHDADVASAGDDKAAVAALGGSPMNVVTFSTVVAAYCKLGLLEEALRVMCDMQRIGVTPNDVTFSHVAWGYMNTGMMPSPGGLLSALEGAGFDTRAASAAVSEDADASDTAALTALIDAGIALSVKTSDVLASFDALEESFDTAAFDAYRSTDVVELDMRGSSTKQARSRRSTPSRAVAASASAARSPATKAVSRSTVPAATAAARQAQQHRRKQGWARTPRARAKAPRPMAVRASSAAAARMRLRAVW